MRRPCGLIFVALNANIERRFEFIMHAWVHNPVSGSLYRETDPLVGKPCGIVDGEFHGATATDFTVPAAPAR